MLLMRGATSRIAWATGPRFGCVATTNFPLRRAARRAAARNLPFSRSQPVKTNSFPPTESRCNSGESLRLSSRHSIPRPLANSVSTAAMCRPARCIPPGASNSGKRPMITRRVCLLRWRLASARVSRLWAGSSFLTCLVVQQQRQIFEFVQINIGGVRLAVMRAEAVVNYYCAYPCVTRRLHVHFGVAHHQRLSRSDVEVAQNRPRPQRIGLLGLKTVAAIDALEVTRKPQSFEDSQACPRRLVGQHG